MNKHQKGGIGCLLISVGIVAQLTATAAFTSTKPIPAWFDLLAGVCFFGWWIPFVWGIVVIYKNRR